MDSVDIYHGLSGQSGQCPWILWTKSSELVHGQSPVRPARLDNVHAFNEHCPWTQWTLSIDSVDSLDIVHGHPGHSRQTGQCPLSPWTDWTLSMDSLDKVQFDLV